MNSRIEIDEYGLSGAGGYGFLIELTPDGEPHDLPLVGHFGVTILRESPGQAHPPTNVPLTKRVLTWLALYRFPGWTVLHLFEPETITSALRERNPPGFGYPGTTDWQWYGALIKRVNCPPLRGRCSLTICQAMPPAEEWDPRFALEVINTTAREYIARDVLARYRG
jgi:hypothetical protein